MANIADYPLFWLPSNNFGDALGPFLYECITGRKPVFYNEPPRILSCGSILGRARAGDVIWGSGFLTHDATPKTTNLKVLALRGPLSDEILRSHMSLPEPMVYGDPALLTHRYVQRSKPKHSTGFFPHYLHAGREFPLPPNSIRFKPMAPVAHTLSQLTSCERVVSSSLHGVIVAESFNIPAVWIRISNGVPGFKFRDYYLGTGRKPPNPVDWTKGPDWKAVDEAFKFWTPPVYSEELLLQVCPFNL